MNNYLQNIVIPFYRAQAVKNISFIVYGLDEKVLVAAEDTIKRLNYKNAIEIQGKKFAEFNHIKPEFIPQMRNLFKQVVHAKQMLSILSVGGQLKPKYKNHHELILQVCEPILDLEQNVVAILMRKYEVNKSNLFYLFYPEYKISLQNEGMLTESLSKREFEILYLLSNGLSQYQIADKLGVSRSTVLKNITDRIMPKLNINNNDSSEIIRIAISLGIQSKIPKALVKEQLIVIHSHIS